MTYRDDTETLRARIATLEAENAALRPTGEVRWKWDVFTPMHWWQCTLWMAFLCSRVAFVGRAHIAYCATYLTLFSLTFIRKVPR